MTFLRILLIIVTVIAVVVMALCALMNHSEKKNPEYVNENATRKLSADATFYEKYIKRLLDIIIAFCIFVISLPIVFVVCILIFIEDHGQVIFKQKRLGVNKTFFNIHKLRTMKKNTGDIPTKLLSSEAQKKQILKVGRFIRKTSIDELGQCIDVIRGVMSIVGPRPALWNQFELIELRDKCNANSVRPGITGLAQINGRDEIEDTLKAKLDGEYVEALRKSSFSGFCMDCKCFFGTFLPVLTSKGVVEGGTGNLKKEKEGANE